MISRQWMLFGGQHTSRVCDKSQFGRGGAPNTNQLEIIVWKFFETYPSIPAKTFIVFSNTLVSSHMSVEGEHRLWGSALFGQQPITSSADCNRITVFQLVRQITPQIDVNR